MLAIGLQYPLAVDHSRLEYFRCVYELNDPLAIRDQLLDAVVIELGHLSP
jgi:hypothetical protein